MKKALFFFCVTFFSSLSIAATPVIIFGTNLVRCNGCTQSEIKDHAESMYRHSSVGNYYVNYIDIFHSTITVVKVNVSPANAKVGSSQTIVHASTSSVDPQVNSQFKSMISDFQEIGDAFAAGYSTDSDFPFQSAYDALQYKDAFKQQAEYYIRNLKNIKTQLHKAEIAADNVAGETSIPARVLTAIVATQVINNAVGNFSFTLRFTDATKIEVGVYFKTVDGSLTFGVKSLGLAYTADGSLLKTSSSQFRNAHVTMSVNPTYLAAYLKSLNITLHISGSGSGVCTTDLTCKDTGTECTAKIISCKK